MAEPLPVALSEEELAEITRLFADGSFDPVPPIPRLLATIKSRDQELANAKEAIEQLLGDDYDAAMFRNGNAALRAELESRDQRIKRLVAVAKASQEVSCRKNERWTWTRVASALNSLKPGDLDPVRQQEEGK